MTSIELRDVTVVRSGRTLLEHVSLTVPDGETLVIVGPPGAGKTLLLQVIVGLVDPTSGDVVLDDEVITGDGPRKRDVSMLFDDYALHPHLDVYDNLAFSSTLRRKRDKAAVDEAAVDRSAVDEAAVDRSAVDRSAVDRSALSERIDDVAEFLALEKVLGSRPDELDDARRQRVATGRALVREANAYLLDEPFSAQSDRQRTHVRSVVLQWQSDRQRTTVLTTSNVDEALSSADRVAVLHQGFVHQIGTPRELYEKPADMFVAGYLGVPPMNLVPGFPEGDTIATAVGPLRIPPAVRERIGDLQVVVVGVRPEHLFESADVPSDGLGMSATVDDIEWRGRSQFAYLGYDIDPAVETVLTEVEDLVDFDLFQSFVAAELPSDRAIEPGTRLSIVARREHLHVFDPVSGENLTQG